MAVKQKLAVRELGALESVISRQVYRDRVKARSMGMISALVQCVENSIDWHALHIWIEILERDLSHTDDGDGMNFARRSTFVGLGESMARLMEEMKGEHGTGRMQMFELGEQIRVDTVSEDDLREGRITPDEVIRFEFTSAELEEALWGGERIREFAVPRSDSGLKTRTGSRVTLLHVFPNKRMADETLLEELGNFLSPKVARLVQINGRPLKERSLIGDEIHLEFPGLPLLGDLTVDLYIPEERQRSDVSQDKLRMGARGPVMDFPDFVRGMPPALRKRVRKELLFGMVCGDFDAPYFNKYSIDSRNDFTSDIYDDRALEVFVNTLELEVFPEIQARIGVPEAGDHAVFEKDLESVREDFADAFGDATFKRRPKREVRSGFALNIRQVKMECGTKLTFRITREGGASGQFEWDATKAGGTITPTTGKEVEYTAGNEEGRFELRVFDVAAPERQASIYITVVREFEFAVSPAWVTLAPGGSVDIYARNFQKTSGKLVWNGDDSGGSITVHPGENRVTYTAGQNVGTYELIVSDKRDARMNATCRISITASISRPDEPSEDLLPVGDPDKGDERVVFRVVPVFINTPRTFFVAPGPKETSLNLNYAHPVFHDAKSMSERRAQFKRTVVDAYAAIMFESLRGDRLFQERDRILQNLLTTKKKDDDKASS